MLDLLTRSPLCNRTRSCCQLSVRQPHNQAQSGQVSSTAQTFVSTSPNGSANSRTTSSVTVVGRPALFFGHETQSIVLSSIFLRKVGRSFASLTRSVQK